MVRIIILSLMVAMGGEFTSGMTTSLVQREKLGSQIMVPNANPDLTDTKSVILEQARKQLEHHFSGGEYRLEVQPRWIPNRLLRQSPTQILAVQLDGKIRQYTNFRVFYRQQGKRKDAEIQLRVKAQQKLPVVTDRVRKGSKLKKKDLMQQWVTVSQSRGTHIASMDQLVGKTLRRTLLSGQPVRKSYVSRDLLIKAGDQVRVVIKREGIQVQVTGEAREDGAKGDRISVYSNKTNQKYEGEVLRPGVIQWKSTL